MNRRDGVIASRLRRRASLLALVPLNSQTTRTGHQCHPYGLAFADTLIGLVESVLNALYWLSAAERRATSIASGRMARFANETKVPLSLLLGMW